MSFTKSALTFYLILFFMLGMGYSTLTPIFENSDETLHYPYVNHVADGRGLPLAVPDQLWNQEGTQPPLYYAIVAASTFWIDSDNLTEHLQYNPHWRFTDFRALINDNQNLVLHGPMDDFPYRRAALAIHIGRWWSLLFGGLTVVGCFILAHHFWPTNRPLILTAVALTALNPQFLRVSATVSNDSLAALLTTLAVILTIKLTEYIHNERERPHPAGRPTSSRRPNYESWFKPILLGLLCGLAVLTKLSSLSVILLVGVIIVGRQFQPAARSADLWKMASWLIVIGLTMLLTTGWWFYRNYLLYGEWLATETHLNLAGRGTLSLTEIWSLRAEIQRAYWATFGWGQIRLPEWIYQMLAWFVWLGLIGWLTALGQLMMAYRANRSTVQTELATRLFLLLWAMINLGLYLRWVMEVGSVSHTRLMFPAIAALSLLWAMGWHHWLPRQVAWWFTGGVTVSLLAVNVAGLGVIWQAFTPHQATTLSQPAMANRLEVRFEPGLQLIAGTVGQSAKPRATVGDTVLVAAHWQTLTPIDRHYSVSIILLAPTGEVLARRETYPGLGLRPTGYLQPGETFVDRYPLQLQSEITEPVVAEVRLNLFDFASPDRAGQPAFDPSGQAVNPVVGHLKVLPRQWPTYQPAESVTVDFGAAIRLIGYDLPADCPLPTEECQLILYWQSLAAVTVDYMVFVHLFDATGEQVAGVDGPPTGNTYPTSWWSPGEIIADRRPLPLTPSVTTIRLGLYDLATGHRLPVGESSQPVVDQAVILEGVDGF